MYIVENNIKGKDKVYKSILLRESYREGGKVKNRTIANLSHCKPEEIEALKIAMRNKHNLDDLINVKEDVTLEQGLSIGAVWTVYQLAKQLGIEKALGFDRSGKLALWQVIARVLDQGSRLSAVRLARDHAAGDVLGFAEGFDEDDLYGNLAWISENQGNIEKRLFSQRNSGTQHDLFLYDVTSSYLEGDDNYFSAYGYNRDGKKGKKQIVIGLLCDGNGDPVSVEVFPGNTQDMKTFSLQIRKVAERFGCERVTFVGDRGMIKTPQINELPEGFHYITAITKAQIDTLIKQDVIQMDLFDTELCEVEDNEGIRYILKRNPVRAKEIEDNRLAKKQRLEAAICKKNDYLATHARARVSIAEDDITTMIKHLKVDSWMKVQSEQRVLSLSIDEEALEEDSRLDGCYAIKTDLPKSAASKEVVHDRYKDLALVEIAFRTCKQSFLEIRPVYVRNEETTRGHVLVVMLAYMIAKRLQSTWINFDLTPEEGLKKLSSLSSTKMEIKTKGSCWKIPRPRKDLKELLDALGIIMPLVLPHRDIHVDTRKKLPERRKPKPLN